MTAPELSYALITPARDEAPNLGVLADCLAAQTVRPQEWIVVDNGSTDETRAVVEELRGPHGWIRLVAAQGEPGMSRGGPIVRAFNVGLAALETRPDIVVKLDGDVSMRDDYFEGLLGAFAADPSLGIASGICQERQGGAWRPLYGTRSHVWGAARAYRWDCLQDVLPLEERQGWDEIDSIKAQVRGWSARTIFDLPFRHHRPEGQRDGSRRRWSAQGDTAHYMGYRFSYLVLRTLYRAAREPAALAMISGYMRAALEGRPSCPDEEVREFVRREQGLRKLPLRIRESLGRPAVR